MENSENISFVPLLDDNKMNGLELGEFFARTGNHTMTKYLGIIKDNPSDIL
jgi:hypothetical protein